MLCLALDKASRCPAAPSRQGALASPGLEGSTEHRLAFEVFKHIGKGFFMEIHMRIESDLLGKRSIPAQVLWGIHSLRAQENFNLAGASVHPELIKAFGAVKLACAKTNRRLGVFADSSIADAVEKACVEMDDGLLSDHISIDALAGGAGTSVNMAVNEVLANRALVLSGHIPGDYTLISPLNHINCHQSTNDTYPTALRLAAVRMIRRLESAVLALVETCQNKEKDFAHIVKVGRTELMDAALITLGRECGAWAEAFARDRWRIYKCEERLRTVNLGGTAVGTGLGAPRTYIFEVVDELRAITGIGFARAENLVDATQNVDVFVEVSGILKACASSLFKVSNDLRILGSGPVCGLGEINLPALQTGSSIMPGKINPVIPEAVSQAALMVMGNDSVIGIAGGLGNLELNHYMPLIAHCLLSSCDLLTNAVIGLSEKCINGITANEAICRRYVNNATATLTALVGRLGYDVVSQIAHTVKSTGRTVKDVVVSEGHITQEEFDALTSAETVCRLGH
jgi:aspartate ammonia-lyase